MGKLILVKTSDSVPRLVPAIALVFDGTTNSVELNRVIEVDGQETNIVPIERCFEFDDDTLRHVNAWIQNAHDLMNAAQQLVDSALTQAEFVTDGDPGKLSTH